MMKAALFDFDGTLVDSFAAITASTNHVRQLYAHPPILQADVSKYVGHGLAQLMADLVPGAPVEDAVAQYREHHKRVMLTDTRLMPGVAETIPELSRRGLRLGVCSNKRVEFTRELICALGLSDYFGCVLGPEDVGNRPKPHPAMLLEGLTRLNVVPSEAVFVGDMDVDVQTAKAAGVCMWLIPAIHSASESAVPDRVLSSFTELLVLLS